MIDDSMDLVWETVFVFPSKQGRRESVVWRKYAPKIDDVHALGCRFQSESRAYRGAITARCGDITLYRNKNGYRLTIEHAPAEGIWHAEISCDASGPDRVDLISHLKLVFSKLDPHLC
jgi:hypothetical protein